MAEQSVGMTSGAGDGTVGGYTNTRMTAMSADTVGTGIVLNLTNLFTLSGSGTSTLTIGIGSVANNGYYYQNTSPLTIDCSAVSTGTYYLVCRVNDTASAVTVIRSNSGTTIPLRSVRLCLISIGSYTSGTDVLISTVTVSGFVVTNYTTPGLFSATDNTFLLSNALNRSIRGTLLKTTTQTLASANVSYGITINSFTDSSYKIIYGFGNNLNLAVAGSYLITGKIFYASGSTGIRTVSISDASFDKSDLLSAITPPAGGIITQHFTTHIYSSGSQQANISVTSSVGGQDVTGALLTAVRL